MREQHIVSREPPTRKRPPLRDGGSAYGDLMSMEAQREVPGPMFCTHPAYRVAELEVRGTASVRREVISLCQSMEGNEDVVLIGLPAGAADEWRRMGRNTTAGGDYGARTSCRSVTRRAEVRWPAQCLAFELESELRRVLAVDGTESD